MSAANEATSSSGAAWCRRFIEGRCGTASVRLLDEHDADDTEGASRAFVLSLAEVDLGDDAAAATMDEYLAVLALVLPDNRVVLRFVSPNSMRSASRSVGARRVVTDVAIRTPGEFDEVSLLVYRIRPTLTAQRALVAIETAIEVFDAASDDDDLVVGRAVLELLEVLDVEDASEILVCGRGLRFGGRSSRATVRDVALVMTPSDAAPINELSFAERTLRYRSTGVRLQGPAYAMLRFAPRSTRESVLELIEEIRRRHQRDLQAGDHSESFERFLGRQADEAKEKTIEAMFAHSLMPPVVTPIVVEVAHNLQSAMDLTEVPPGPLRARSLAMRMEIEQTMGISIPGLRVRINASDLPDGTYIFMLDEIPVVSGNLNMDKFLCLADAEIVGDAEEAMVPDGSGRKACWIPASRAEEASRMGFETWDTTAYITEHLRALILANLNLFATADAIDGLVLEADATGALLDKLRAARGGLPRFGQVIHALLLEQLPVVPIGPLAAGYLDLASRPPDEIAGELRLCPSIVAWLARDVARWKLFRLDDGFEAAIGRGVSRDRDACVLSLEPVLAQELLSAVRDARKGADNAVEVLCVENNELRTFVRSLIELEFPQIRVLARREIERVVGVPSPVATISLKR